MKKSVIAEVMEYLNSGHLDDSKPNILKVRIKNCFDLSDEEANKVYRIWKSEYMKPKNS